MASRSRSPHSLIRVGVLLEAIVIVALASLAVLGAVAARTGGANVWKGAMRVSLWSSIAMASTAAIGSIFGAVV